MITGTLRLFTDAQLDRLHGAVLRVLGETGIRIYSDVFLSALAAVGASVDRARGVARFPPRLVETMLAERPRQRWVPKREQAEPEREYKLGLSGVIAPYYHDYDRQVRRPATRQDLLDTIYWAETDLSQERNVDLAVTMSDVDPRVEPIEAYALLLQHTNRPGLAYSTAAEQIPFLIDMAEAWYGQRRFPRGPDFMTSPLTLGHRLAQHTLAALEFGQREFGFGVMPISGGNAPMTIAGNIVQSAAEGLGIGLAVQAVAPDATWSIAPCNGIIDMRKGTASFNAPEALLADLGVCELFNRHYGGGSTVAALADYIDAALPGIQAAYERTYRAMAIAAFVGEPFYLGGQGTLDAGQVFSPVQFILERDMGEGLWRLGQGIAVSEDTLAVDVIAQVGSGGEHSFLDSEHTLHHYRETWFLRFLYRGEYEDDDVEHHRDKAMLDAANAHYKDAISRYAPPAIDSGKLRDVLKIVERARQALLG